MDQPKPPLTARPAKNRRSSVMNSAKFSNSIGRKRNSVSADPKDVLAARHAEGLKKVDFLSDQIDRLTILVETRKVKLATIKNMNNKLDDDLYDLSLSTGSALSGTALDDVQKNLDSLYSKILHKLEKNLEISNQNNSKEKSIHRDFKQKINEYRQKKTNIKLVNQRLEDELFHSKDDLMDRLHALQNAQKTRLVTECHIAALKNMLHGVEHTFKTEWNSLTVRLQKERDDIEDVQRRSAAASQARNWEDEVGKGGSILKAVQEHAKVQKTLKDKTRQAKWDAAQQRLSYRLAQKQLDEYREALALLHKRLDVGTADDLLNKFEESETAIFERLRQVNSLTAETEQLETKRRDLKDDLNVVEQKSQTKKLHELREQEALNQKEAMLEKTLQNVNQNLAAVVNIVHTLTSGVDNIFHHLECETTVPSAVDGIALGGHEITPTNLMMYLGIVQQRCNNILMLAKKKINENTSNNIISTTTASGSGSGSRSTMQQDEKNVQEHEQDSFTILSSAPSPLSSVLPVGSPTLATNRNINNVVCQRASPPLSFSLKTKNIISPVSGPVSPVRTTLERTLRVDLLSMSVQLNKIEQKEDLSILLHDTDNDDDSNSSKRKRSRRRRSSSNIRKSSMSSSSSKTNRSRSPTIDSLKSDDTQRLPSPTKTLLDQIGPPVTPLSRAALLNGLRETLEL